MYTNRRDFLRKSITSALGGIGLYSVFGNLQLMAANANLRSNTFNDYKALVCVYLYGGNDSFNTIVPYDNTGYTAYAESRQALALPQEKIQQNNLIATVAENGLIGGTPSDGGDYGLHPAMPELRELFNNGKAAIVSNVGTLLYPITKTQYQNHSVGTPPQLFSHSDQMNYWQTSRPDNNDANGWGGRIADLLHAANNDKLPMSISLLGNNRFQRGASTSPYSVNSRGVPTVEYLHMDGNNAGTHAFNTLLTDTLHTHKLERTYASVLKKAVDTSDILSNLLTHTPSFVTQFPTSTLGTQLAMTAKLIATRTTLGLNRQIFYVGAFGYDTHGGQLNIHDENLSDLSKSLKAFYEATVELGIADSVTTFTASDFGRSLAINEDGTDHGWGGHHFIIGDAVRGQRFYGKMPNLSKTNNPDDTGLGQIIPTIAVDQYAATLASWFGVDNDGIRDIFPNIGRFNGANMQFFKNR